MITSQRQCSWKQGTRDNVLVLTLVTLPFTAVTLQLANGIALGYTVAGIAPNMDAANGMLPALVTLHLFFAGQLKTYDSIPK